MARKKQEDPPKGSPAWMATFSDLMNLLLCFFVLLFSMSTVSEEKLEMLIQSFQNAFSIMPSGGTSFTEEGTLISSGVSALDMFDVFFNASTGDVGDTDSAGNEAQEDSDKTGETGQAAGINEGSPSDQDADQQQSDQTKLSEEELTEQYEEAGLKESEKMAEAAESLVAQYGIQDQIEVTFNGQYILLTLNGALLFDNGKAEVKEQAVPLVDKLAAILESYGDNLIQIEGHTDNVPMRSAQYENNDVLSMYRAYYVAERVREVTNIDPSHVVSAGRGEYYPVADNATAEGRALNRRVEVKIFNSYNSGELN